MPVQKKDRGAWIPESLAMVLKDAPSSVHKALIHVFLEISPGQSKPISARQLAKDLGLDQRTVRTALSTLVGAGALHVAEQIGQASRVYSRPEKGAGK